MKEQSIPPLRTNRSFVIREGRFTNAQKKALGELWPKYVIPSDALEKIDPNEWFTVRQPIILDIGFGSGDSLISLAQQRPDFNFIGVEVYRPGIGAVLQKIAKQELDNIRVMNADVVLLLKTKLTLSVPKPKPKAVRSTMAYVCM